ncbi:MAG: hypothetical protein ACOH1R_06885 [Luteimonas sp.]
MIEAIQVAAMEAAQSNPAASPATQPQATAFDVHQFADTYARGGMPAAGGPSTVTDVAPTQKSEGTRALLSAFENLNGGAENINAMSQAMSGNSAELTPGDMLKMTMECHQFLFKAELTSNVANRTSDGVQQLFKQQS